MEGIMSHQVLASIMKKFSSPNYTGYCGRDSKGGDPKNRRSRRPPH